MPLREMMRDKRVAGGLAAMALLFVAYRVVHTGKPPAAPAAVDNGALATTPAGQGGDGAARPNGAFSSPPSDNAQAAALPRADVAWNWERNPFIGPPKPGAAHAGGGDEFPTIIVPGFGAKGAAVEPAHIPAPAGGDRSPGEAAEAVAEALPVLRGTVLCGGRSLAIFGNRTVAPGDQVADWTVFRVTPYAVSLRKGSERRTIDIFRPDNGGKP